MNEDSHCAFLIKQIHSELEKNANNMLREQDLTLSQASVLMELDQDHELELKQLEKRLHVAQSTTVGIVHRLEQKGFVEMLGSPDDKRVKIVRITESGQACCDSSKVNMQLADESLSRSLTDAEREILIVLLKKIRDSFQE